MSAIIPAEIVAIVARSFGLAPDDLFTATNHQSYGALTVRWGRKCAIWAIMRHTPMSWSAAAAAVGMGKGGVTVRFAKTAVDDVERDRETDPQLRARLDAIEDAIDSVHESRMSAKQSQYATA